MTRAMASMAAFLLLAGCGSSGARDVEYTQERGISSDIDATQFRGSSANLPGMTAHDQPLGSASSWRLGDRH